MDKQKIIGELDNFWYYYKTHILVGVFIVAIILYMVFTVGQTKDSELHVVIIGNAIDEQEQVDLEQLATEEILGEKSGSIVNLDFWIANDGLVDGHHGDLQQKLMTLVTAKDIDVFIMNANDFVLYAKESTFLKLDSLTGSLPDGKQYVEAKSEDDVQSNVYGIKMENNQRLKQAGFDTQNKVLAIADNTKHPKLSSQWVKWVMKP